MTNDPARFRPNDIQAIYHDHPRCFLTLHWQWVDPSHILGRGESFGFKKDDSRREIMSSILNLAPLQRDIHKGPHRDHRLMRRLFLELAAEKVREAVMKGDYELSEIDHRFIDLRRKWLDSQPAD